MRILLTLSVLFATAYQQHASECPLDCVYTAQQWYNHNTWPLDGGICGIPWIDLLVSYPSSSWERLAREYIASQLNQANFDCIEEYTATLTQAWVNALDLLALCEQGDDNITKILWEFNHGVLVNESLACNGSCIDTSVDCRPVNCDAECPVNCAAACPCVPECGAICPVNCAAACPCVPDCPVSSGTLLVPVLVWACVIAL